MINGNQLSERPVLLKLSSQHNGESHMLVKNPSKDNQFLQTSNREQNGVDDLEQKIEYLNKLKVANSQMVVKIKQINKALDSQVDKIKRKMQNKASYLKKPIDMPNKRDKQTEVKYQELHRIKKQLDKKLALKNSIDSLEERLKSLKSQYKQKFANMQQILYNLNKLKTLKNNDRTQSRATTSTPHTQKVHSHNEKNHLKNEITELKGLVKVQTQRIYREKSQFIKNNKIDRKNNHSTLEIRREDSIKKDSENLTPEAKNLKAEYKKIGKRIEILKNKKLSLMISEETENRKKYLTHLQKKLVELQKIIKK